ASQLAVANRVAGEAAREGPVRRGPGPLFRAVSLLPAVRRRRGLMTRIWRLMPTPPAALLVRPQRSKPGTSVIQTRSTRAVTTETTARLLVYSVGEERGLSRSRGCGQDRCEQFASRASASRRTTAPCQGNRCSTARTQEWTRE